MPFRVAFLLASAAALLIAAGCGDADDTTANLPPPPESTEPREPEPALESTDWVLESFVDGQTESPVPEGVGPVTMTLRDGLLSIDTGCNGVGADYEMGPSSISLTPGMSTEMFCGEEINQVEMQLRSVLDGEMSVVQDDGMLLLRSAEGRGLVFTASD